MTAAQRAGDADELGEPWDFGAPVEAARGGAPVEEVVLARSSQRRMDPARTLPEGLLRTSLAVALRGIDVPHFVAVHAVDGVEPGLYRWPDLSTPERAGALRDDLYRVALEQGLAHDAAFVAIGAADVSALDDRGYREAQLAAGLVEGNLHLLAYALGASASGMTFDDSLVRALPRRRARRASLHLRRGAGVRARARWAAGVADRDPHGHPARRRAASAPGGRAVDLGRLPRERAGVVDGRDYEPAGAEVALVEELHALGAEDVEPVRAGIEVGRAGEAVGVDGVGVAALVLARPARGAEELDPAVGPAPRLPRVVDRDGGRTSLLDVARVRRLGIRQPDELELAAPGEVRRVDVRGPVRGDGRDRAEPRRVEQPPRRAREALAREPAASSARPSSRLPGDAPGSSEPEARAAAQQSALVDAAGEQHERVDREQDEHHGECLLPERDADERAARR